MKLLWFEDANGHERAIANCHNWKEVTSEINNFVNQCNVNKANARKQIYGKDYDPAHDNPFHIYCTRIWKQEDGRLRIDVGSHTEFFIWEGSLEEVITSLEER